jgi:thiamine biosynthesis protein ThiI
MLILVRFSGELTTKARQTRIRFTKRLIGNIDSAFERENLSYKIQKDWSRLFIETQSDKALGFLSRIFGIQSLSVVEKKHVESLEELLDEGERLYKNSVENRSFAVRARRVGGIKDSRFPSQEIERELGARLYPFASGVDLSNPQVTVSVEIHGDEAYFFSEKIAGPGGLPLGARGRGLALISGGFDSAVAAWLILKRGVALDYVFLNLGGQAHMAEMLPVTKVITDKWSYGDRPQLFAIDFESVLQELQRSTNKRYWQVILKRLMFKAADSVAHNNNQIALVTGEVIGQVSSQTLPNLVVISDATGLPILRPLLGFDKHEIVERARRIGTNDYSEGVEEYCALVARYPVTRASLYDVEREEQEYDFAVLDRAISEQVQLDLNSIELSALNPKELEIEEIPEDALAIDLRNPNSYRAWHFPNAIYHDFFEALSDTDALEIPSGRRVVTYCEVGIKSAQLAEKLRKSGIEAYHFKGGMRELMRYAIEHDLVPIELLPPSAYPD